MKYFFSMICIVLAAGVTQARILRVNNTTNMAADYTTLAAAVSAAASGSVDTIHIEGSLIPYTGNVVIDKKVVIIGPGYFLSSTAETQYNKETAKFDCNITFGAGSDGSVLAGVTHHTGAGSFSVNTSSYAGNRVIVQTGNISIVSCRLFYLEIDNTQPLSNITVQRCFFNPGVITATGAGVVSGLTVTNCFFRNDYTHASGNYLVINGAAGTQSGWRISQNTFYSAFNVVAGNTTFTNNVFYGASASTGAITTSSTNACTDNVMRYAVGGMTNGADRNIIPPTTLTESQWFSRAGNDATIDIYYTSASSASDCPLRDGADPGSDAKSKGMYGGGAPYVKSGMFTIPSVYDIVMDAEVGDSFNMVIRAKTH